jgi:hypothetical protein
MGAQLPPARRENSTYPQRIEEIMDTNLFPTVTVTLEGQQWTSEQVDPLSRTIVGPGYSGVHRFAKQMGGWHNLDREKPETIIRAIGGEERVERILTALGEAIIRALDAAFDAALKAKREAR